ncbi:putative ATP-dependent RNA helicase DDX27 [Menidia menidia]
MLGELGLIGTIQDEDQSPEEPDSESDQEEQPIVLNRRKKLGGGSRDFNCDFEFGERDAPELDEDWALADVLKQLKQKKTITTLDQKIDTIRKKRKAEEKGGQNNKAEGSSENPEEDIKAEPAEEEEDGEEDDEEQEFGSSDEEILTKSDTLREKERRGKKRSSEEEAPQVFFEDASEFDSQLTFDGMNLSRPILKVRART